MKMTDGFFYKVFDEVGKEYPELKKDHWIVDIGAAKLAETPEVFDVIVMPILYGDILSDVATNYKLIRLCGQRKDWRWFCHG
jgi:isocitrate dehydrogenase